MKFNEDKPTGIKRPRGLWVGIMALILVVMIGYSFVVNNNEAGHYVIIEPIGSDSYDAVMEPGRYFKWFNRTFEWEKSATYWFSMDPNEGSDSEVSVSVRYNDGGTASITGSVRYTIGEDRDRFIRSHIQYRNEENFRDRAIGALVTEALTLTATLMSAEESYTTTKAQFTEWALDQLNNGVYLVTTYIDTVTLPTGGMRQVRRSKLRTDKDGNILRKDYALKEFNVEFSQFVIQDPEYQPSIKDQITGKLNNLMGLVASQAEAELKAAEEATVIAEGQRNVTVSEYEQKVLNVVDIITSEISADTARILAEARKEVSSILKQAAEFQRDANIYDGEGEASYKQALQRADANMEIRLKLWLKGHESCAAVIAQNGVIYPDWIQPSGSAAETGMSILNYSTMKQQLAGTKKE